MGNFDDWVGPRSHESMSAEDAKRNPHIYCYLDIDIDNHRSRFATAAAFVDATNTKYGFSSKDLRRLGGSEVSRIEDLISADHEWSAKNTACGGVKTRPPEAGNRIIVRLLWDVAPLACENFARLCRNGGTTAGFQATKTNTPPVGECGKPLTYRNCKIHRIEPGFIVQGGDFVFGNGSGGESIFGKKFKDEKGGLDMKHDRRGLLSMGNSGKNSNSSQFFITFAPAPQCNAKHVVFGEVISGFRILDEIEKVGSDSGEPLVPVNITECGLYSPLENPGAGYWYDQPDAESYSGISSTFVVRARVGILAPNQEVFEKFVENLRDYVDPIFISADVGATKVLELVSDFAVDVVLVAPACSKLVTGIKELPPSWGILASSDLKGTPPGDATIKEVIVESIPKNALMTVRNKTWVGKQQTWQLFSLVRNS
eukprot:scaffold114797_cov51-Attheya_sp.AAC.5